MYNIHEEIENVLDYDYFDLHHEMKGHCLKRHVISKEELQTRLWEMPKCDKNGNPSVASRFDNIEDTLNYIYYALAHNESEIIKWRRELLTPERMFIAEIKEGCGYGMMKGTDYNQEFIFHQITVVLQEDSAYGRGFYVKTAYPSPTFSDYLQLKEAQNIFVKNKKKEISVRAANTKKTLLY